MDGHAKLCHCADCVGPLTPFDRERDVRFSHRESLDDFDAVNYMYLTELQPRPLTRSSAVRKANREAMAYTDDAGALTRPQTATGRSFSIVPSEDYDDCVEDYSHSRPTTAPQVAENFYQPPLVHPADFYYTMRPLTSEQKDDLRNESIANSQHSTGINLKRFIKNAERVIKKLIPEEEQPVHRSAPSPKPLIIQQGDRQFINYHRHLKRNVSLATGKPHPSLNIISREEVLAKEKARKEAYERLIGKALIRTPEAPRAKRMIGSPDRQTVWEDFTNYVSPPSPKEESPAEQATLSPPHIPANLNNLTRKPVPLRVPTRQESEDSEFEVDHRSSVDSQYHNMKPTDVFQSLPLSPRQESLRRKTRMQSKPINEQLHRVRAMESSSAFHIPEQHVDAKSEEGSVHTGFTFPSTPFASPISWLGTPPSFPPAPRKTRAPPPPPLNIRPGKDYFYTFPVTYNLRSAINQSLTEPLLASASTREEDMESTIVHPSDSTCDEVESSGNQSEEMDPAEEVWRRMEVELRGGMQEDGGFF